MYISDEHKEIIKYVKKGLTNIEIGEELGYSPSAIKKKLKLIYQFYNVRGRIDLIGKLFKYSM